MSSNPDMSAEAGAKMLKQVFASHGHVQPDQEKPREIPPIRRGIAWKLNEHANNSYRAFVHESISLTDLEDERVWAVVASDLRPHDRVSVIAEDRKFWADCLVVDAQPGKARIVVLQSVAPLPPLLDGNATAVPAGHDIYREGAEGRYMVKRLADDVLIGGKDGFPDFETARRALLEHASMRK